jgi:hypothetical protein
MMGEGRMWTEWDWWVIGPGAGWWVFEVHLRFIRLFYLCAYLKSYIKNKTRETTKPSFPVKWTVSFHFTVLLRRSQLGGVNDLINEPQSHGTLQKCPLVFWQQNALRSVDLELVTRGLSVPSAFSVECVGRLYDLGSHVKRQIFLWQKVASVLAEKVLPLAFFTSWGYFVF